MLGLADRGRIVELFGHVMAGATESALEDWKPSTRPAPIPPSCSPIWRNSPTT
jgi:hypothetical protein